MGVPASFASLLVPGDVLLLESSLSTVLVQVGPAADVQVDSSAVTLTDVFMGATIWGGAVRRLSRPSALCVASPLVTAQPTLPTGMRQAIVLSRSGGALSIEFLAPMDLGGSPLQAYGVYMYGAMKNASSARFVASFAPGSTGQMLGLLANTSFVIRIVPQTVYVACALEGTPFDMLPSSSPQVASTTAATTPAAPSAPVVVVGGASSISVAFTPPADFGGTPFTAHRISMDAGCAGVFSVLSLNTSATAAMLNGSTPYCFIAASANAVGWSANSSVSQVITNVPTVAGTQSSSRCGSLLLCRQTWGSCRPTVYCSPRECVWRRVGTRFPRTCG
jgi:hypothetical protein